MKHPHAIVKAAVAALVAVTAISPASAADKPRAKSVMAWLKPVTTIARPPPALAPDRPNKTPIPRRLSTFPKGPATRSREAA